MSGGGTYGTISTADTMGGPVTARMSTTTSEEAVVMNVRTLAV